MIEWIGYIIFGLIAAFILYVQFTQRRMKLSKIKAQQKKEAEYQQALKENKQISQWTI